MAGDTTPEITKLTDQFVCVRAIQMGGVDLATFQFDPFLSWSVFMMNGDKTIYGRFGRAHPQTKRDKKDSNPNHSVAGLRAALEEALEVHAAYTADSKGVGKTLEGKTGPMPRWRFAEKTPAAKKYGRLKIVTKDGVGCVHCHEVHRVAIDSYFMTKKRLTDNMLWLYPQPKVLGLGMDNRYPARVSAVEAGSWAEAAGLEAGDDIETFGGQPLVSIADLQWVLQNFPDEGGELPLSVRRGDDTKALVLTLPDTWRYEEDFVWRYRMAGYASWLWAGFAFHDDPKGVRVGKGTPGWFKRPNRDAMQALKTGDIIVDVDGNTGFDRSEFLAYLMRDKRLGSKVKLEVLRRGEIKKVSFNIPRKQPEVQGY